MKKDQPTSKRIRTSTPGGSGAGKHGAISSMPGRKRLINTSTSSAVVARLCPHCRRLVEIQWDVANGQWAYHHWMVKKDGTGSWKRLQCREYKLGRGKELKYADH